jgi:hypothetical protein
MTPAGHVAACCLGLYDMPGQDQVGLVEFDQYGEDQGCLSEFRHSRLLPQAHGGLARNGDDRALMSDSDI